VSFGTFYHSTTLYHLPVIDCSCSRKGTSATVVSRQRVPGNHHIEDSMPDQEERGWRICGSPIRHIHDVYYLYQALEMIVHLYPIVLGHCSE
jgi:hypothetical protein